MIKKRKRLGFNSVWSVAILFFAFLFTLIVAYTNAYFTSHHDISGDLTFSDISLEIDSTNSDESLFSAEITGVVPGDTLVLENVSVTNVGNEDVFSIVNLNLYIVRDGYTDQNIDMWYNLEADKINVQNIDSNNVYATKLAAGDSEPVNLEYYFAGALYDDSYQDAEITVTLKAFGIQTKNLPDIGDLTTDELIATKMLVDDFYVEKASNVANINQLQTQSVLNCTTPTKTSTSTDSSNTYNLYNVSLENANAGDTVYVQVKDADKIFITSGNQNLNELVADYEADGELSDGNTGAYGQTLTSFTIEDETQVVALSSIKRTTSAASNKKFSVFTVSTSSTIKPIIKVYTTPQDDLPTIENDLGVYLIDYSDIKTGSILHNVPVETLPNIDGETCFDIYNFKVENVTQNSTVYVYASDARMQIIGYGNMLMTDAKSYIDNSELPPNSIVRGYLSGYYKSCAYSFNVNAGEQLKFFVVHMKYLSPSPKVQIYCVPQGELPGIQNDVAYRLLEDGTGYSAFAAHDLVQTASILDTYKGLPVKEIEDEGFNALQFLSSVTIGNNVEIIKGSFEECHGLTSIEIPASVKTMTGSFYLCENLSNVTFDANSQLKTIGNATFAETNIGTINLPNGLETIGEQAFLLCKLLDNVTIPNSVTTIGYHAFYNCDTLTTLTLNEKENSAWLIYNNNEIEVADAIALDQTDLSTYAKGDYTFEQVSANADKLVFTLSDDRTYYIVSDVKDSSITYAKIPEEYNGKPVKQIGYNGNDGFYGCKNLQGVIIPSSVTIIEDEAFKECTSLTSLIIPGSVNSIGYNAFKACTSLTSLTIKEGVKTINGTAFEGCANLTELVLETKQNLVWIIERDPDIICKDASALGQSKVIEYLTGYSNFTFRYVVLVEQYSINYVSLDNGETYCVFDAANISIETANILSEINGKPVTYIGQMSFVGCTSLTSVTIPSSVTSIETSAFKDCSSLNRITLQTKQNYVWEIWRGNVKYVADVSTLTQEELITYLKGSYNFRQVAK